MRQQTRRLVQLHCPLWCCQLAVVCRRWQGLHPVLVSAQRTREAVTRIARDACCALELESQCNWPKTNLSQPLEVSPKSLQHGSRSLPKFRSRSVNRPPGTSRTAPDPGKGHCAATSPTGAPRSVPHLYPRPSNGFILRHFPGINQRDNHHRRPALLSYEQFLLVSRLLRRGNVRCAPWSRQCLRRDRSRNGSVLRAGLQPRVRREGSRTRCCGPA